MALERAGWIGNRDFAEIRDPETGVSDVWVCLKCEKETPADPGAFAAHDCGPKSQSGRKRTKA